MRTTTIAAAEGSTKPSDLEQQFAPRIYYVHPLLAGPFVEWSGHVDRCRDMGFDCLASGPLFAPGASRDIFLAGNHESVHPALQSQEGADDLVQALAQMCGARQLNFILEVVLDRVAADSDVVNSSPGWFRLASAQEKPRIDPRSPLPRPDTAYARFDDSKVAGELTCWWINRLSRFARAGVAGFLCRNLESIPPDSWHEMIEGVRRAHPECGFLAWTPGVTWPQISGLTGVGFNAVFSSLAWWDGRSNWLIDEHELLRRIGSVIACPEAPFGPRLAQCIGPEVELSNAYRHKLRVAAVTGAGLMVPMGFEWAYAEEMNPRYEARANLAESEADGAFDLTAEIRAANALSARICALGINGEMRALTGPGRAVMAMLRSDRPDTRHSRKAVVILINTDLQKTHPLPITLDPLPPAAGESFNGSVTLDGDARPDTSLDPGEVRPVLVERTRPARAQRRDTSPVRMARTSPRIVIDNVTPAVDAGRFAVKRVIGERIIVEADVFSDGHGIIAAELLWRSVDEQEWRRLRMQPLGNDRWQAAITPIRVGRHLFTLEAWWDEYATFCRDIDIKSKAGADVSLEIAEGRALLETVQNRIAELRASPQAGRPEALAHAPAGHAKRVAAALSSLADASAETSVDLLLAPDLREAMAVSDERPFLYRRKPEFPIEVERPQARYGSWYELFPRSATDDVNRHGTFDDVIRRLPTIREMGFDVLYFPPVHPIGTTNRKGRNNILRAEPGDLGSPYAIGSNEGGHDAIHPALGTIEDFRRLRDAAAAHGLEIALDFAIQCSPDHPWLKQHPGWFQWRPDGTVRFAENPPKKYEDIVGVDFYASDAIPRLWTAWRDVILYWVGQGVHIFRVDNPHTKPLPFWEWLIGDIRGRHPQVIFLSEAFTRPKMMYRLAKLGFSQSYTYFTWRNTKQELVEYLTELTASDAKEYFRPHFFVNTPDINPFFLQTSGRPGFLIRAALAATLSGLWGIYSGFELCEAAALPGREEYLDSEKYEIRVRRHDAPGNIIAEIAKLNRIRKANPALQSHLGLRFYNAFNDKIIYYGKPLPAAGDMILVAVSLDPHAVQEATIEVPLWEWRLPDNGSVVVEDLMRDHSFVWSGKLQQITLDPQSLPFAIWRIAPLGG